MSHENSQLDIPDRPLLGPNPHPSEWTEIGEAQITHTIFGRAKVRIIRKHDKLHRALWLMAIVVAAAAAWQGWRVFHPADIQQSADSLSSDSVNERLSSPDLQTGNTAPAAEESVPATTPQSEPSKPEVIYKAVSQPVHAEQMAIKPAMPKPETAKPLLAIKPQSAPTGASEMKSPLKPLPHKPLPPRQPTTQAIAAPHAIQPAIQPAASSPAAMPALAAPIYNEDNSPQSPANDHQPAQPANVPGK